MPKISVVMNCLNGERFVGEAIRSVYDQTFADWEIVFWDNGSTDRTAEIARGFDGRLRYFRGAATVPLGAARRLAMAEARGQWIGFLDHDDRYLPTFFDRLMTAARDGDFALCYAGYRTIDAQGRLLQEVVPRYRSGAIVADLLRHYEIGILAALANAGDLRRFGIGMHETFDMCEEYNLFMRLAAKGRVCVVPDVLGLCRIVSSSLTERAVDRHADEMFQTLDELCRENPGLETRHRDAYREAEARALYYRAKHLMQSGRNGDAHDTLRRIRRVRPVYLALYLISYWPRLWRLVHDRTRKARLTTLIFRRRRHGASALLSR